MPPLRIGDAEEPVAFDREVERVVRRLKRALVVVGLRAGDARAQADFDAGRRAVAVGVQGARQANLAIEQVLEVGPVLLEAPSC